MKRMPADDSPIILRSESVPRKRSSGDAERSNLSSGRRMSPAKREEEIVREAVRFFAEFGFEGQTRELAKRLNITQPLLYRYFQTKDALVERVYQEVFLRRWNPFWEEVIQDRSKPLRQRLVAFYQDYSKTILTYEWIRLFMFSGLKGLDFNARYLELLRKRIFNVLIEELRIEFGAATTSAVPVKDMEIEAVWSLHAAIFYLGVRKFIYNLPVGELELIVEMKVLSFVDGVKVALGQSS
ncbi:Bacterial regulatory proteins, tetR family [bacterium YEK0313]|nr:Bacterial regulatory proteins, tetR family [bacterium YEK0313]